MAPWPVFILVPLVALPSLVNNFAVVNVGILGRLGSL